MSALGWLRARSGRDREVRMVEVIERHIDHAPKPIVTSAEALRAISLSRFAPETVDLEEYAARVHDAVLASSITPWPKAGPGECLCCLGRYSTCRNLT